MPETVEELATDLHYIIYKYAPDSITPKDEWIKEMADRIRESVRNEKTTTCKKRINVAHSLILGLPWGTPEFYAEKIRPVLAAMEELDNSLTATAVREEQS